MRKRITRRTFLKAGSMAAMGATISSMPVSCSSKSFDVVIKGGTVFDGTGKPGFKADVGISADTITAVADDISSGRARKVIDAQGLCVSPGFIDIHSHSDSSIISYPTADSRVLQGVTTEVTGNCGGSIVPVEGEDGRQWLKEWKEENEIDSECEFSDPASYFDYLERTGISVNHALLAGNGTLRSIAAGSQDRAFSADELKSVSRSLEICLDQGCVGFSTGLEYVPCNYSRLEELEALVAIAARRDALYATHIRNESATLLESIEEAVEMGRKTGVRVEISHFKAAGKPNWNKQEAALELIDSARAEGVDVKADAYPYTAYSTGLMYFMPYWAEEGGQDALEERLRDPAQRKRIRSDVEQLIDNNPGGFDQIVIASVKTDANRNCIGLSIQKIGENWKVEPVDALLRLVEQEHNAGFIGHGMDAANVEMILAHPHIMIGSDGYSYAPWGKAFETRPHPRSYGAFARVLAHYCRERKLFSLPDAVKKMTSMPAAQLNWSDRGILAPEKKADLAVFDSDTVRDNATFENPHRFATGVKHVLVAGVQVVEDGKHTGAKPGGIIRKA
jgi:N-acyl-D-amino-acid deacylase